MSRAKSGVQGAQPPAVLDTSTVIFRPVDRAGADPIVALVATVASLRVRLLLDETDPGVGLRAMLVSDGLTKRADRQADCCSRWRGRRCLMHHDCQAITPNQCGVPGCPQCQGAIARQRARDWQRRIKVIAHKYPPGPGRRGWRLSMLTVTLRSGIGAGMGASPETLKEQLKRVHDAFRDLWCRYLSRMGKDREGIGAVCKAEVGGRGAVHLHALLWGPRPDAHWLQSAWRKITGDSWNTRVDRVLPRSSQDRTNGKSRETGAIHELVKYVTKPMGHGLGPLLTGAVAIALAGTRNYRSYGSLRRWRRILGYGPAVHADRIPVQDLCPVCGLLTMWEYGRWADSPGEALEALAEAVPRAPPGDLERVDPETGEVSAVRGLAHVARALAGAVLRKPMSISLARPVGVCSDQT